MAESLVSEGKIILKKCEGRTLKSGGSWVFDNEIEREEGHFENGDIVNVLDFDGFFMGYGFINRFSKIRVRMLSRYRKEPIDRKFLEDRVRDAWIYRKSVTDTSSCRLIFGEADCLPGLTVDKYEDILVFECLSLGMEKLLDIVMTSLVKVLGEDGIDIRGIYERSEASVRKKEGLKPKKGWYWKKEGEDVPALVSITENGVKYTVDVENGQKTGFFLDQKRNRAYVQELVKHMVKSGQYVRVLDCFTHMGTFALNAALAGASHVTAVDISDIAIKEARKNAETNGLADKVDFVEADVFEDLPARINNNESYDIVILDPPAFTKSREATKKALNGYREINIRGMKLVRDGGFLVTCSCSHFMTQPLFEKMVREASHGARKRLRQVLFSTQAPDHPILVNRDENSYYLKFYIFQVYTEK
jgi:23S rRNA (cytosine1962-C5)-methyltransferase